MSKEFYYKSDNTITFKELLDFLNKSFSENPEIGKLPIVVSTCKEYDGLSHNIFWDSNKIKLNSFSNFEGNFLSLDFRKH